MKLAQLNPLLRQAISLIKALNIKQEGSFFVLEVRCGLLRCEGVGCAEAGQLENQGP